MPSISLGYPVENIPLENSLEDGEGVHDEDRDYLTDDHQALKDHQVDLEESHGDEPTAASGTHWVNAVAASLVVSACRWVECKPWHTSLPILRFPRLTRDNAGSLGRTRMSEEAECLQYGYIRNKRCRQHSRASKRRGRECSFPSVSDLAFSEPQHSKTFHSCRSRSPSLFGHPILLSIRQGVNWSWS